MPTAHVSLMMVTCVCGCEAGAGNGAEAGIVLKNTTEGVTLDREHSSPERGSAIICSIVLQLYPRLLVEFHGEAPTAASLGHSKITQLHARGLGSACSTHDSNQKSRQQFHRFH